MQLIEGLNTIDETLKTQGAKLFSGFQRDRQGGMDRFMGKSASCSAGLSQETAEPSLSGSSTHAYRPKGTL